MIVLRSRPSNFVSLLVLLGAVLLTACAAQTTPPPPPATEALPPTATLVPTAASVPTLPGWELVWQDDFEGDTLNLTNWTFDLGAGGWGNNKLQYYTDRPENVRLADGTLIIEAREEEWRGSNYSSARLKTQSLQAWTYGRIESRMKLPTGQGIWSAFWMLGEDIESVGWPRSGEIDIMENIGAPNTVYGTIHGPGYSGGEGIGAPYTRTDKDYSADYHTFAIEWTPTEIRWFVDDASFNRVDADMTPGPWVFDDPFFAILNVAVGGNWPGYPDESTQFPQQLVVDYVRVYRDPTLDLDALAANVVHVEEIAVDLKQVDERWQATVFVTVVDQNGNPVAGATVSAGWVGAIRGADTEARTNENGIAGPFVGQKISRVDEITYCISDVSKALYDYDKNLNSKTCVFQSPE